MIWVSITIFIGLVPWVISLSKEPYNWPALVLDLLSLVVLCSILSITIEEIKLVWHVQSSDSFSKFFGNSQIVLFPSFVLKTISYALQKRLPKDESRWLDTWRWIVAMSAILAQIALFFYLRDLFLLHEKLAGRL
jgi:hypothetical protein